MTSRALAGRSIDERLNLQARVAIGCSVAIVTTILVGSIAALDRQDQSNVHAQQAVQAAILEKDFTSLQRDTFRHAALLTAESLASVEENIADLDKSIAGARDVFDDEEDMLVARVAESKAAYVKAIRAAFANGTLDRDALARAEELGDRTDEAIEAIRDPVIAKAEAVATQQCGYAWLTLIASTLIALIVGGLSFVLARRVRASISGELGELAATLGRITGGRFDTNVPFTTRPDEIGELARAAVHLRETSKARESADAEMRALVDAMVEVLDRLAQGDLTVSLPDVGSRFAKLRADFNGAVRTLHDALSSVAQSADAIACGASEIDAASGDLSQRTESHASELGAAATSLSSVTGTVRETAESAAQAASVVGTAVREADEGGATIRDAVGAMSNIERASHEITQIVGVIDGITFQTNLLALNAGVEAARAGDAGKGFAVVASEVRALAQRSSEAAHQIRSLIETSSREVSGGVELVRRAGAAFGAISGRIGQITALVDQIREGAGLQSENLAAINHAVSGMDRVTQQNAAMVEQSSAAARTLSGEAKEMARLVGNFRVARSAVKAAPAPRRIAARAVPQSQGNLALAARNDDDFSDF